MRVEAKKQKGADFIRHPLAETLEASERVQAQLKSCSKAAQSKLLGCAA